MSKCSDMKESGHGDQADKGLTDAEVISTFMEPLPERHTRSRDSEGGWWRWIGIGQGSHWEVPVVGCFTLDRLREVEGRITELQWTKYEYELADASIRRHGCALTQFFIHASADQKKQALAAVIRGTGGAA